MMENLWKYQWLREDVPLNQEFVDAFYHESAGIIDRVVSLYEAAQINAIFSETDTKEKFAPEFIGKISKSYFPESSKRLHILADDMLDNSMIVWSDLYRKEQGDWNGLKNSIKPSEDLTDLITNPDFQKEIMDYDVKWNHTIQTVWEFFEDGYSRKEIEKALNSLRLSKRSIIKMEEGVLRKKVIKALMEPEWMKSDDDAESYDDRYELPICTGLE